MGNNAYFEELSRILRQNNIECGPVEHGRLVLLLNGQSVGWIDSCGIRYVATGDLMTAEGSEALHKAAPFAEMVSEYMGALKRAPLLEADGLDEPYRLLAEFNGVVLAGKEIDGGYGIIAALNELATDMTVAPCP